MFGIQSSRLLRSSWQSAKLLAEELYAMFQATDPLETIGGLTVSAPPGVAALTLKGAAASTDPVLAINGTNGTNGTNVYPLADGGINISGPTINFTTPGGDGSGDVSQSLVGVFPGVISGGSGSNYSVSISLGAGQVRLASVRQLSINPNATIPPGTAVVVFRIGSGKSTAFFMQHPVWI